MKSVAAWRAYSDVECMTRDDVVALREDRASWVLTQESQREPHSIGLSRIFV